MTKLTDIATQIGTPIPGGTLFYVVDPTDTTDGPSGTSKVMQFNQVTPAAIGAAGLGANAFTGDQSINAAGPLVRLQATTAGVNLKRVRAGLSSSGDFVVNARTDDEVTTQTMLRIVRATNGAAEFRFNIGATQAGFISTIDGTAPNDTSLITRLMGDTRYLAYFLDRATAVAATIPTPIKRLLVGDLLFGEDTANGTALVSADARKWSPIGHPTPEHWGTAGDGVTDDTAKLLAWTAWTVAFSRFEGVFGARTYRAAGPILIYNVGAAALMRHFRGQGKNLSKVLVNTNLTGALFQILGTSQPGGGTHTSDWVLEGFTVEGNGVATGEVLRVEGAHECRFDFGSFNVNDRVLNAKELWDSQLGGAWAQCGRSAAGNERAVATFDVIGAPELPQGLTSPTYGAYPGFFPSGVCNNIRFLPSFRLEANRWTGLDFGPRSKKVKFPGVKFHGDQASTVQRPTVRLRAPEGVAVFGCNFGASEFTHLLFEDATINAASFLPIENVMQGNFFRVSNTVEPAVKAINTRRTSFEGNTFDVPSGNACIRIEGASSLDNFVFGNTKTAGAIEVSAESPSMYGGAILGGDLANKAVPDGADRIPVFDSSASFAIKYVGWSQITTSGGGIGALADDPNPTVNAAADDLDLNGKPLKLVGGSVSSVLGDGTKVPTVSGATFPLHEIAVIDSAGKGVPGAGTTYAPVRWGPDWDASTGAFPGGAAVLKNTLFRVSVQGTVDSVLFNDGDVIRALVSAPSTTTFASNWSFASRDEIAGGLTYTPTNEEAQFVVMGDSPITNGMLLAWNVNSSAVDGLAKATVEQMPPFPFDFGDGTNAVAQNEFRQALVEKAFTIKTVTLTKTTRGAAGSVTVRFLTQAFAAYDDGTTALTVISGSDPIVLSAAHKVQKTSFTGWTLAVAANTYLVAEVTSTGNPTSFNVQVEGVFV